jgi:WD40 repeat protein
LASGGGGEIKVWDMQTGNLRHRWETLKAKRDALGESLLGFSPTGKEILSIAQDTLIRRDVETGQREAQPAGYGQFAHAGCSPVAPLLVVILPVKLEQENRIEFFLYLTDYQKNRYDRKVFPTVASAPLVFSPDGGTMFVASTDGPILAVDTKTWAVRATQPDRKRVKNGQGFICYKQLAVTPDGATVVGKQMASGKPDLEVWRVGEAQTRALPNTVNSTFALSPDGKTVAVGLHEELKFVDVETGQEKGP